MTVPAGLVGLAYSFQSPQYLYMVQEYLPNHTLAQPRARRMRMLSCADADATG